MKKLAITTGDPAGIGPEVVAKALQFHRLSPGVAYVVYGDGGEYRDDLGATIIEGIDEATRGGQLYLIPIPGPGSVPGKPSPQDAETALNILNRVTADLVAEKVHGVVTASVSKSQIRLHDPGFIGHTEYFARASGAGEVVMSFWGNRFNLALLTTHCPVSEVPTLLTNDVLRSRMELIARESARYIHKPRIAVLGANPHAGEEGAFGDLDTRIARIIAELTREDINIAGPFPADTFFTRHMGEYDLVVSAWHDQGLIPFKMLHRDAGVNVTLGLPFVRVSPDHGTAFDIAGKDKADESSMLSAIRFAERALSGMTEQPPDTYSHFSPYYDMYMGHVDYDRWVRFILETYNRLCRKSPGTILELACGTANVATRLVHKGFQVDACDYSPAMLKVAHRKNERPRLYLADLLDPIPRADYDLVLLLFDSLNYLLKSDEVETLLKQVYNALVLGGVFIFDISTLLNSRDNFDGFVNLEEYPDCYFIHTGELNPAETQQTTRLTFFKNEGGCLKRYNETHKQRVYRTDEIRLMVEKSDFSLQGIYTLDKPSNQKNTAPSKLDNTCTRLFFVLRK